MQMTSREFNQDLGRAKRESLQAPVIVTDRGKPKHVLLNYEQYQQLASKQDKPKTLFDWFASADSEVADIDLPIPQRTTNQRQAVELD